MAKRIYSKKKKCMDLLEIICLQAQNIELGIQLRMSKFNKNKILERSIKIRENTEKLKNLL